MTTHEIMTIPLEGFVRLCVAWGHIDRGQQKMYTKLQQTVILIALWSLYAPC